MTDRFILYVNIDNVVLTKDVNNYCKEMAALFTQENRSWLKPDERIIVLPIKYGDTRLEKY